MMAGLSEFNPDVYAVWIPLCPSDNVSTFNSTSLRGKLRLAGVIARALCIRSEHIKPRIAWRTCR